MHHRGIAQLDGRILTQGAHNGLVSPVIKPSQALSASLSLSLPLSAGWAARREGPRAGHKQFNSSGGEKRGVALMDMLHLGIPAGSNRAGGRQCATVVFVSATR